METSYTSFSDFLHDESFIRWQLTSDETTEVFWIDFIQQNPHLECEIRKASEYLKTTGLNKNHLTPADRSKLLGNILKTVEHNKRKKKINSLIRYSAASAVAITLILVGVNVYLSPKKAYTNQNTKEVIVGNLLESEKIELITGEKSVHFENDIEVQIDEKGTAAIVTQKNGKKEEKVDMNRKLNKLVVPYGRRSQLKLADGSKIWLNSGSILEFPTKFTQNRREINLASGEMYIEVAHDKKRPFKVNSSGFNVKVYGTKFNISSYSGSSQFVVLVEGRISMQSENKQEIFLSPNEQGIYSEDGNFNKQKVNVNQYISWKSGYLTFDKTPMTEVLRQIGRYYNLSFNYDNDANLQKRFCTGKIYLSENLNNVMTTVGLLTSTKCTKNNNQIYIKNEPN